MRAGLEINNNLAAVILEAFPVARATFFVELSKYKTITHSHNVVSSYVESQQTNMYTTFPSLW